MTFQADQSGERSLPAGANNDEFTYYRRLVDELGRRLLAAEEDRRRAQVKADAVSRINRLLIESGHFVATCGSMTEFSSRFIEVARSEFLSSGTVIFRVEEDGWLTVLASAGVDLRVGTTVAPPAGHQPPAYGWSQRKRASDPFLRGLADLVNAPYAAFAYAADKAVAILVVRHQTSNVVEPFGEATRELITSALAVYCSGLEQNRLQVALQESEARSRLLASVFEASGEGVCVIDLAGRIVAANDAFTRLTGYQLDEIRGRSPDMLSIVPHRTDRTSDPDQLRFDRGHWHGEGIGRRNDGASFPLWITTAPLQDHTCAITHHIISFTDMSELKASEEQTRFIAHHDLLTGLPNRVNLQTGLGPAIAEARRRNDRLAVLFIDLNRFKPVNDGYGHHVGDQLLIQIAHRLKNCVRSTDLLARFGGDEFVVVMPGLSVRAEQTTAMIARKILEKLREPFGLAGLSVNISGSIGISLFPGDGDTGEILIKQADAAMYQAKATGDSIFRFFDPAFNDPINYGPPVTA